MCRTLSIRYKAIKLIKEAAETGLLEAMVKLSDMYLNGKGCNVDCIESKKWMERAASKGDSKAQYEIGKHYLFKRNYGLGCYWLEKAANQGHVQAMFLLGEHYVLHPLGVDSFDQAIKWLSKPVFSENSEAVTLLAQAYEDKEKYEHELSFTWSFCLDDEIDFEENCNYDTYYQKLEDSFESSQKVVKLYEKALRLHEEKASFGSWKSALEVAQMYLYGIGCKVNKEKAFDYYYRLANQPKDMSCGECNEVYRIRAVIKLAKMYELGVGCQQNIDKCNELIQKNAIDKEWFKEMKL